MPDRIQPRSARSYLPLCLAASIALGATACADDDGEMEVPGTVGQPGEADRDPPPDTYHDTSTTTMTTVGPPATAAPTTGPGTTVARPGDQSTPGAGGPGGGATGEGP